MARNISMVGLNLFLFNISCAHECRYCLFGDKHPTKLPFARFARLVERMAEWIHANQSSSFWLSFLVGYSRNTEIEQLREHNDLNVRIGNGLRYEGLPLGGLRFRSAEQQSAWLKGVRDLGVTSLHASFAGHSDFHDHWNGRKGDFNYLMALLFQGAELGLRSEQTFFLIKSTVPLIDELKELSDRQLGKMTNYHVRGFNYMGFSKAFEDERINEDVRDVMPTWVKASLGDSFSNWRSEREWIDVIMQEPQEVQKVELNLRVDETNIDRLEAMSARAIFEKLASDTRKTYEAIPLLKDLCSRFGDHTNTKIYQGKWDLDAAWQDRAAAIYQKQYRDPMWVNVI